MALKAVVWPAVTWVITDVLFYVAANTFPPAGQQLGANLYPIATTIGLPLAVWAGAGVKQSGGKLQEAVAAGIITGLGCGIPAVILFGAAPLLVNIVIFSIPTALAGWGLK